ncbi:MAG: XrtA-associated tyrosine autokinase [Telluria sp.]
MNIVELQAPGARYAAIDLDRLRQLGMVTQDGGRTGTAEDFRIIKRPLLHAAAGARPRSNLIVVTSALPGEGKTYCAVNLAMSMAMEKDHTVMLVDADVARPSVLDTLGLAPAPGLMDLLLDERLTPADVILRTNVPSLTLLPAGRSNRHATELLASQAMSRLLDDISSRYADRIVIFDSPPVLLTTEAGVLASRMGQVVLVVEAEKTTQRAVRDALERLGGSERIGLVCNKTRQPSALDYEGYYA